MKKLTICVSVIMIMVLAASLSYGQNYHFSKISAGQGKGFITSGFNVTAVLKNDGGKTLAFVANNDRIYLNYQAANILYLSGGFFLNAPWIGPMISYNIGPLSLVHWLGWGGGDYDKPQFVPFFFFADNWATLTVWRFELLYMLQHVKKDIPQHVIGLTYSQPLNEKISCETSIQHDVAHGKYPLMFMSVTCKL